MIFPVSKLIQHQDKVITVRKTDTVRYALMLMVTNDFSQLPIVDDLGFLTGVISEQSITHTYFHGNASVPLFDLPVYNCQANPITISPESDVFDALQRLKDVTAIVVVRDHQPIGIVTYYDATYFFRTVSEGLMYVEDIEVTLRQYIDVAFPDANKLDAALVSVFGADKSNPNQPNRSYERMSFYDHIQFITHQNNWKCFEAYFEPMGLFRQLMDQVRGIRNRLAHFRDEISVVELHALRHARDWLAARPKPYDDSAGSGIAAISPETVKSQALVAAPAMKSTAKYAPLRIWLAEVPSDTQQIRVKFRDIEQVIEDELPPSARTHRAWWSNDTSNNTRVRAWLEAGWRVAGVDMQEEDVIFERSSGAYYQVFFEDVLQELRKHRPDLVGSVSAGPRNHLAISSGIAGMHYGWSFNRGNKFRVELYVDFGDQTKNQEFFDALQSAHQSEIESRLHSTLSWERLDQRRACRVALYSDGSITDPPQKLDQLRQWTIEKTPPFIDTFQPLLRDLANSLSS